MQSQPGLVQQEDEILAVVLFDLREPDEKREEPNEASAPLVKANGYAMPAVLDPRSEDITGIERRRVTGTGSVEPELHIQVPVLTPIGEYLLAQPIRDGLKLGYQLLEPADRRDVLRRRTDQGEQCQEDSVAEIDIVRRDARSQAVDRHSTRHLLVLGEV